MTATMTETALSAAPQSALADLDLTTDQQSHSVKPQSNKEQVETAVHSVVSSVVSEVARKTDTSSLTENLAAEKTKVQSLINKLVAKAHDDANSNSKVSGVPFSDHRGRRLANRAVCWTQTMDYVTINVDVPKWVCKQHVDVQCATGSMTMSIVKDGKQVVKIGGPLVAPIDVDGCIWSLEGDEKRILTVELEKAKEQWWARLFMSDDPNDYVVEENMPDGNVVDVEDVSGGESGEGGGVESEKTESEEELEKVVQDVVENVVDRVEGETKEEKAVAKSERKVLTRADLNKMVEGYKEAFKKGGLNAAEAAMQLATFYHHGIGVEHDDAEAARMYRYALENGIVDASAAFQLALICNQGANGMEPDPVEAVRWWSLSARLGNAVAMFNLGVMKMNGSGCDMDPAEATKWFTEAQRLNSSLRPPVFSKKQLEERMVIADRLKRKRMREGLSVEEKKLRRDEAFRRVKVAAAVGGGVLSVGVGVVALRYWWRNRL